MRLQESQLRGLNTFYIWIFEFLALVNHKGHQITSLKESGATFSCNLNHFYADLLPQTRHGSLTPRYTSITDIKGV